MSWAALVLLGNRSSLRIQDEPVNMRSLLAEVQHVVQRARDRIGRAAAGPAEVPIVFDEAEDGRLIRDGVIDEVRLYPGRNHERGQARAEAAAAILGPAADVVCLRRAAIAWPQQLVVRHIRLGHDGPHLVIVPAVRVIPCDNHRRFLPFLRLHERVDDVHDEDLFVDRIRIAGMAILLRPGLHVAHGRQPTLVQRCEEVRQVVLVVRSIVGRSDQHWITWPRVVHVCGLRVIHERFVVRDIIAGIHNRVVAGETRVMLAAYCAALNVHTGRHEASLEPSPRYALGV